MVQDILKFGPVSVNSRGFVTRFGFTGQDQQTPRRQPLRRRTQSRSSCPHAQAGGNVLLLDEPTNDLDVNTIRAGRGLENFAGCAVIISHDRWFLDRMATHILAFEGDSQVHWFEGNYQAYEAARKERLGIDAEQPHRIKYRKLTKS